MKRFLTLLTSILIALCLASCATIHNRANPSQDPENVQAIEIYYSDEFYSERNISSFRKENEPITVLNPEEHAAFLDTLTSLKFEKQIVLLPIPMDGGYDYGGYIVAVVYTDGAYDIVAEDGLYSYSPGKNGQGRHEYDHSDYCGATPWADIFEEYSEDT